ncbi:hypothetical protein HK105_202011 [Polyrhizophydium stewartii]|uniref:Uncharacterized protein n=1 Tax=Polyrhizophydium stewartii TaxID=2732419 RepID=A0ABR4NGF2_9FUNG
MIGITTRRLASQALSRRAVPANMVQARSNWSLSSSLPNLKGVNGETTLGEVWDRVYVKYRYRLMYPLAAWIGFLWYNLWIPYTPASEKAAQKARMDHLKSLEFKQE